MHSTEVLHFASQSLWLVLVLSLPTVLMAALVGTLVSLVQALTQVQEQTLGFVAKLVAVVVTLFVTADWMGSELYRYTDLVLNRIPSVR
ncbi:MULTISPECIES: type III secretion system export apparatus subunit SctS [unclassified Pseudomonas]|jgi:type III secretion protein S|uniref:type III secretion system export apparatus subunit SctS n=1 Tax=unclassified Pseudomonas TaxID=196821 RepID=UPI001E2FD039|nr:MULTISPECIES: type III secretion system export apparatus subunit SctS [unclassified Pseudomonas]MDC0690349.1 type III secretion system export apparatus subunit SctS [Mitsuaria sp. RG]MCE0917200.1 type III secretion system export apparatus subunit SctS [Pseudomonas sp. NMI760_13]MCF1489384.1 type III secretion system export apparatus subunit SctS [Pseudomonas sp. AA27]MCP8635520.1 type III secretion system export apparatus subunit SctS [Pseudomonas sp. DVZ6]MDD7786971.1 type III secretion sy